MKVKTVIIIVVLCVAVVFLLMDKCGSDSKSDKLKGQWEEANKAYKADKQIREGKIRVQEREIEVLNATIEAKNTMIAIKGRTNARLDTKVAGLEAEFAELSDKDAKIGNLTKQVEAWKEKFSIAQSIIADKDEIIFSLTQKYNAQLKITNEYKDLHETLQVNTKKLEKIVIAQDRQIKILKLTSGIKTGLGLALLGVVIYGVLK